jgi:molybdenum cofactor cytidylyltransferase
LRLGVIVLAAGLSTRMGRPKALLPCRGRTFLATILDTAREARVETLRVVLGADRERVLEAEPLPVESVVLNPDFEQGMLSSVRCGVRSLPASVEGFFLWPVDHPLVQAATLAALADVLGRGDAGIVLPVHAGRRGHPSLFAARLTRALLEAPDDLGARAVARAQPEQVREVEVEDAGVVTDIDTPERYRATFGEELPA